MAERSLEKELDVLRADLSGLKDDISSLTRALSKRAGKVAADGRAQAEDFVGTLADDIMERGEQGLSEARAQISERPLASLLVAFGAGIVLSKLIGR